MSLPDKWYDGAMDAAVQALIWGENKNHQDTLTNKLIPDDTYSGLYHESA